MKFHWSRKRQKVLALCAVYVPRTANKTEIRAVKGRQMARWVSGRPFLQVRGDFSTPFAGSPPGGNAPNSPLATVKTFTSRCIEAAPICHETSSRDGNGGNDNKNKKRVDTTALSPEIRFPLRGLRAPFREKECSFYLFYLFY